MFYPFTARIAQNQYEETEKNIAVEQECLKDAYLRIAHVYINRACRLGRKTTMVFLPHEIAQEAITQLECAGFIVDRELPDGYRRARPCYHKIQW